MMQPVQIEVIVCTTLESRRTTMLLRAIDSIRGQTGVQAVPIVVANGERCDNVLMNTLANTPDIHFRYIPEGSLSKAMRVGRGMVKAPFFAFLDDDDELLSDALSIRLSIMCGVASPDVVVTGGHFEKNGLLTAHIPDILKAQRDPLYALTQRCWLSSCGALFRTDSVTLDYLDGDCRYHEQTLFAFRLVITNLRIRFSDTPTYIVHDTPDSLSKSEAQSETLEHALKKMLSHRLPPHVRKALNRKYRNALHVLADSYRRQGQGGKAWRYHLRSMRPPYTLHYLAFTRKLLTIWLTRSHKALPDPMTNKESSC